MRYYEALTNTLEEAMDLAYIDNTYRADKRMLNSLSPFGT